MTDLLFREDFLRRLAERVPDILADQDPATGRFGKGIWMVNDQHSMYPLAVAWATESPENPYYHDPKLLDAIISAGDALIDDADENGQWEFRKKDGSTWGQIFMPWTYCRWLHTFSLVRDGMPEEARAHWEKALLHGYTGIAAQELEHVHNIPTYHAMGLYIAGMLFDRPEWKEQASQFLMQVVESQDPGGFWSENSGPVVAYNAVYVEALGIYYAVSHDARVLPALERSARFHANFTYPDGSRVETVDERNCYHTGISVGTVGLTFTAEGRGYLLQQFALAEECGQKLGTETFASLLNHGEEGPASPTAAGVSERTFVLGKEDALIRRTGPWFICMSAYHCPIPTSRWIQDRQNLVSIYHDRCGLILGGGNTKLQPLWSNFTVGDPSLLKHTPGDESPDFRPRGELYHIPSTVTLNTTDPIALELGYGEEQCMVEVDPVDESSLRIRLRATVRTGLPVEAHLVLMRSADQPLITSNGEWTLEDAEFELTGEEPGEWIEHAGWRLSVPPGSRLTWPVLPHNPYRKDGSAFPCEGRMVLSVPFTRDVGEQVATLSVG